MATVRLASHSLKQSGSALIISLLLLFILTILALAGARNSILQERMTGNMVDRNMAFQAAEAAIVEGERALRAGGFRTAIAERERPGDPDAWLEFFNDANNAGSIQDFNLNIESEDFDYELFANPRFVIEELPQAPNLVADQPPLPSLFRITVIGQGGTENSIVILQSASRL